MKDILGGAAIFVLVGIATLLYIYGMYKIVVDDHRYTTKDVAIGMFIFPYPWWVGGKEFYRVATISAEDRNSEEKCLDVTEALGLKRKSRIRYCECMVETKNEDLCEQKIFVK